MTDFDLRVISLGAGIQSSCMVLKADQGLFGEIPDAAIFADTQAEPPWVYEQVAYLERTLQEIPIYRVTAGNLREDVLRSRDGRSRFAAIPLRVKGTDARDSMLRRQCTREYKIEPITRKIRELLGLTKGERVAGRYRVEQWIGISLDEVHRVKDSRYPWIKTRHPLVFDIPMRRGECAKWMEDRGHPLPKKSACAFCPYHDDRYWLRIRKDFPEVFADAVAFDREIRKGKLRGVKEDAYLHRSLKPLDQVEFNRNPNQRDFFDEECEGMCGL
jgi:hypothetical protein